MKKHNLFILFILLFIGFKTNVKAFSYGGCNYSQIARLKSFASNVNITYDYYIQNNTAYFNVTLTNITPEIYFIDSNSNKKYTYSDTQNGQITIYNQIYSKISYKFYSNLPECHGVKLNTKYHTLPSYNIYYNSALCKGIENYNLCQKWVKNNYSYDEFEELVNKYKNSKSEEKVENEVEITYEKTVFDYFVEFYVKYYYLILIGIIVICFVVIYFNKKKNSFNI